MTGSYFRGDSVPILSYEEEELFDKVTYTYYEQLDGYEHLKVWDRLSFLSRKVHHSNS